MDARYKLILDLCVAAALFISSNLYSLIIVAIFVAFVYASTGLSVKLIAKSLKPIIPLVLFTAILNLFFIGGEIELLDLKFTKIYLEGVRISIFMAIRIIVLIIAASILTYATSPIALTDGLESLFSPLKKLKAPVHEFAMMTTIALRFIPTLIEETDKIMKAQKARGARLDSGGIKERVRALTPILIPLFISAFRRASDLATAMECRCYRGGEGRTRLKTLKSGIRDYIACAVIIILLAAAIVSNAATVGAPLNFEV